MRYFAFGLSFFVVVKYTINEGKMREQELNTMMSVVSDPINNVYKLENRKDIEEIQRIIRIFNISEEQNNKHRMLSIKNMATLKLVLSNN